LTITRRIVITALEHARKLNDEYAAQNPQSQRCVLAVIASLPENLPESIAEELIALGIVPLCGLYEGLAAVERAAWLLARRQRHHRQATHY